jgi:DNA repair protein RadD
VTYKPRDYQSEIVRATLSYIESGGKAGLICLGTGCGKSVLPALVLHEVFKKKPFTRAMMVTHRKTLIEQNFSALKRVWREAPCGIYSAGLKRRDTMDAITYAGIQSVHKKADVFGKIDILFCDEGHLIPEDSETMYGAFLEALRANNPDMVLIGMTATPFRLKTGLLVDGPMFDDVIIDKTLGDEFTWFIDQGYLVDVRTKDVDHRMSADGVKKAGGEFVLASLAQKFNRTDVSEKIVAEVVQSRGSRKCGITFAINIEHAEELTRLYNAAGIPATVAHSQLDDAVAEQNVADFVAGKYEMLVDVEKYTTGFDCPWIDLIVMARMTESAALSIQMNGRGVRPVYAEGFDLSTKEGRLASIAASRKPNGCLVLDFAGNALRLGPMNAPLTLSNRPKETGDGEILAPMKGCPKCKTMVHAAKRTCGAVLDTGGICDHEFPIGEEIGMSGQIIPGLLIRRDGLREERLYDVSSVKFNKAMNPNSLKHYIMVSVIARGVPKPLIEVMYMTDAAWNYSNGMWNVLLPKGPSFPYKRGDGGGVNADRCLAVLNEKFNPSKILVWTNHLEQGKPSPKIIGVVG